MNARKKFDDFTAPLRYGIVKLVVPSAYRNWTTCNDAFMAKIGEVPRPMILSLKSELSQKLVGVEIGVADAKNALCILTELPMEKLYLIDPYSPYTEDGHPVLSDLNTYRKIAHQKLVSFSQVSFIEKTAAEAASEIPDGLDFVYIDGNHDYTHVKSDIALYYPKVKPKGTIGGHDYGLANCQGVNRAVNEFVATYGYEPRKNFFAIFPDWYVTKRDS